MEVGVRKTNLLTRDREHGLLSMKILQTLEIDDTTYIFTENPEEDVVRIKELYDDEEREEYMGYETPQLTSFDFLGNKYPCISFWHDNEDVRPIEIKN